MQISKTIAAAFAAAALSAIAGSPALASPSADAGVTYRTSLPSSNPHDVFRRNIKVDEAATKTAMAMKDCDYPMMKGASASKSGHGG
ncbi:hypothetical protein [Caulobacter rhizosphaerae]|jgi:hypothetical protein|uniref:hypothetical protein n=1 Tax=Caulobacter rhizosphaerae TaxID=2010972 RepID=UPI0013D59E45|nr:hypothetical protein [Caulobacter rhizosphaerae]GGL10222.1 hypothetical protein GCM10010983_04210 [Caulobacter rhizosphaerae]